MRRALLAAFLWALPVPAIASEPPRATEVLRRVDRFRGFARPYRFRARVERRGSSAGTAARSMIEVQTDGRAGQLITVLEPTRGDRILRRDGEMWLRPRNLHRLTRLPPELRLFGGAAISDVAAVDLLRDYEGRMRPGSCQESADYVIDLAARGRGGRYTKGVLVVACGRWAPRRLELMAPSGKALKVITYADVAPVLDGEIATRLEIDDAVMREASTVRLFGFEYLAPGEIQSLTPEYLLSMRP